MSPKARQSKGQARVTSYEKLLNQEAESAPRRTGDLHPARSAARGCGLRVRGPDQVLMTTASSWTIFLPPFHRAAIVGIVGPNGAGKTTLLKMIVGTGKARQRLGQDRRDRQAGLRRPIAHARPGEDRLRGDLAGRGHSRAGQPQDQRARLLLLVQLRRQRPAKESRHPLGRRTQPRPSGKDPHRRRERPAARRTDQRPGCQYPARPGGSTRRIRRDRHRRQSRPLVPRPHLHPHHRLRRRLPGEDVSGQLVRLRSHDAGKVWEGSHAASGEIPDVEEVGRTGSPPYAPGEVPDAEKIILLHITGQKPYNMSRGNSAHLL